MPPKSVLAPSRVCQVYDEHTKAFGTGYRIATRLILTAHHVVEDAARCTVRLSGRGWDPVERVWYDEQRDLALMKFLEEPPDVVEPVGLGRLHATYGIDRVRIRSLGFPHFVEFRQDDGGVPLRPPHQVEGHLSPGSVMDGDRRRVTLDDAPAYWGPEEHWTGMSGAPVFGIDSGLLLGVFELHLARTGPGMHEVRGFADFTDPEWERHLGKAGVQLPPEPLLPDGWDRTHGNVLATHRTLPVLSSDHPPFVTPEKQEGKLRTPGEILDWLTRAVGPPLGRRTFRQPPAILLVGPPGCGKSRTCVEVAEAAAASDDGWTVIHLTGATSLDELEETVEALPTQVLLVLDDLDRVTLPPHGSFGSLLTRMEQTGTRLALLASTRPRWLDRDDNAHRTMVFNRVQIPADPGHQARIQAAVFEQFAPRALKELGRRELASRCGLQPAIAAMLAQFYEELLEQEQHVGTAGTAMGTTGSEFATWVDALLRQADLRTPRDKSMTSTPSPPGRRYVACAAVLATVPLPESEALHCETRLLDPTDEMHLIERLHDWGLLHRYGDQVRTVHDSIADEYLRHILFDDDTDTARLRQGVFEQVLDAGRFSDTHMRNLIRTMERLYDTFPPEDGRARALIEGVQQWWRNRADDITVWLTGHASAGTLLALLADDLWQPSDEARRRGIVESWLIRNGLTGRAWQVLASNRAHDILPADVLRSFSLSWVAKHHTSRDSYVLLNHLLRDPATEPPLYDGLVRMAGRWLTEHGLTRHAPFILSALLSPAGQPPPADRAQVLLQAAVHWLENRRTTEATFLVKSLLDRNGLRGQALHDAVDILLDDYTAPDALSTSYILPPLLERMRVCGDLRPDQSKEVFSRAFAWLSHHGETPAAGHVLAALVAAPIPYDKTAHRALHLALIWLRDNPTDPQGGRLHSSVLKTRIKLTDDDWDCLRELTPEWLKTQGTEHLSWPSVFAGAVRRRILEGEDLRALASAALDLYERDPLPSGVRNLVQPLLMETELDEALPARLLALTFGILRENPTDPQNSYLLTSLFRGPYLPPEAAADAVSATVKWLDGNPRDSSGIRLLSTALALDCVPGGSLDPLANRAVDRITLRTLGKPDGLRLLETLRSHRAMYPPTWNRVVSRTCSILRNATRNDDVFAVLAVLLRSREGLSPVVLNDLHARCLSWAGTSLPTGYRPKAGSQVLGLVLEHPRLSRRQAEDAVEIALRWMGPTPGATQFGRVLAAVLGLNDLPAELTRAAVGTSLQWLERFATRADAAPVLLGVCGSSLTQADTVRAAHCCATWLSARGEGDPEQVRRIAECRKRLVLRIK
ncbi:S1 family peptidase [Streptomyces griseus]|uniref:S1 family peptidase n=1 Tax=Streptomyces griseus TaxID=1911 RepID=UPI0008408DCD|nr:serine protease [Streptomyces griseus]